jgi:hypothetical protein
VLVRGAPLLGGGTRARNVAHGCARASRSIACGRLGDQVAPVPRDLPIAKLREYLGPTAARAAEALDVGGTSDPQRSGSGYHVLVVLDRSPGFAPPLSDVQEEVRAELRRRGSERALRSYLDDLRASADVRVRSP